MSSIKEEVYGYLKVHPKAGNVELYREFPEYNRGSIKVYRNKFLQIITQYKNTFNISQYPLEGKKDETIDMSFFLSLIDEVPLFPAYIFSKLYWKTKRYEGQRKNNYSIVDLYIELFNKIISGKYNMDKIYDFSFNITEELRKIYTDLYGEDNNKPIDIKGLIMQKNFYSVRIVNCVNREITKYVLNLDYGRRIMTIKKIKKKKGEIIEIERNEKEKQEFYNEIRNFVLARILTSYIYFDLQLNAPHLRNRDLRFVFRDLIKMNMICSMYQYINKEYLNPRIYNNAHFFDAIEVYNNEIQHYDKSRQIKCQFEKYVLQMTDTIYDTYIDDEEFNDELTIIKNRRKEYFRKQYQEAIKDEKIREDFELSHGQIYDENMKKHVVISDYNQFKTKKLQGLKKYYETLINNN